MCYEKKEYLAKFWQPLIHRAHQQGLAELRVTQFQSFSKSLLEIQRSGIELEGPDESLTDSINAQIIFLKSQGFQANIIDGIFSAQCGYNGTQCSRIVYIVVTLCK